MRPTVVCFFLLSFAIAIFTITVDGDNTSSVSKKIPAKLDDKTIICNEAIKSLEKTLVATLEKKFEQLLATVNKTTQCNPSGKVFVFVYFISIPFIFFLFVVLTFFSQDSHLLRVRTSTTITSKFYNFYITLILHISNLTNLSAERFNRTDFVWLLLTLSCIKTALFKTEPYPGLSSFYTSH